MWYFLQAVSLPTLPPRPVVGSLSFPSGKMMELLPGNKERPGDALITHMANALLAIFIFTSSTVDTRMNGKINYNFALSWDDSTQVIYRVRQQRPDTQNFTSIK